ncbi:iron permease [Rhodoblastus acidophilus]|uniref:Iron permease n=1 Tax=Rhodoblastus acidophilus TaxID=1074 RepID=A0A6N8DL76_RHOAC|nr:FTR1 family protein [Rhodoblastus acidophilus]MCW2274392.1 high-affinity iron transporter [Rhodoblastus acidophilus]MTV31157.1 iron permease [Rhodoblastus acidophilus]
MLGALIIVFREVIEAGLIVGIVLAVTRGVPRRGFFVAGGVGAGVLGACLLAIFAKEIAGALEGMGQEVFNAAVLIVAACMLAWHNVWMASHGREMAAELRGVGQQVAEGGKDLTALAIVVAVAVLREGSEVVLFLYGVAASGKETLGAMLAGGAAGVALGAGLSALMFYGLVKIPAKTLFGVTTALITFLAAGMAAQSVVYLQQAGLVEAWSRTLWNTSALLPDDGILGRVLHVLFGYVDQPSGMQVAVYLVALASIFLATRAAAPKPPQPSLKVAKS